MTFFESISSLIIRIFLDTEELAPGLSKSDNKYSSIASLYCFLL